MLRKLFDLAASITRAREPDACSPESIQGAADRLIAEGNRAEGLGRSLDACEHYRAAVEAAPRYALAHLNLGIGLEAVGDIQAATKSYEAAHALAPENAYASYNLGRLRYAQGALPEAERLLLSAISHKTEFPEASVTLAHVLSAQGNPGAAASALQTALRQRPEDVGAMCTYATVLRSLDKLGEAESMLRRALDFEPDSPDINTSLGDLLRELGRATEAALCYRRSIVLQPNSAEAYCNLGNALWEQGLVQESMTSYRRAIALKPDFAEAHCGLGNALVTEQRDLDGAVASYEKALELVPEFSEARYNLGNAFMYQNRQGEALECYRKVLARDPEHAQARWLLAICQLPMIYGPGEDSEPCRTAFSRQLDELDHWFDASRAVKGSAAVGMHQPFCLAYQELNNRELLQRYGKICARLMSAWLDREGVVSPKQGTGVGAVRVGIVSQHFWNHSVWNAIVKGWFHQIDRGHFALYAFYPGSRHDEETQFAQSRAARFDGGGRGLRQWVEAILGQQLDVLVYPEVGMDPVTLKLASLRLAPVQVVTWGHPETSGLPTIDYYLSAEDMEPPDAQANYAERLVTLPHLGCFYRARQIDPVPFDLSGLGIDPDTPLLVCPGMPFKYVPEHDWIFAEIASRLGQCRIIFFTPLQRGMSEDLRKRLRSEYARRGLHFDRFVTFIPWQPRPAFYGLLKRADVFLDTIGFSGFNTAMEAVECGLPIVTREGRFLRGRFASGILKRMGLHELVAETEADYVALAVRLCQDTAYRTLVRQRIEDERHVLFEDVAPIRAFENFLASVTVSR